ncbi:DUF2752 domain-containing protein [Nocardioides daejeonensis]|uniref:DUF2752 domain-containing protein n=1 Tax=Nocardioides daejeonensis TaxID=1046556 RepID=UPI001EF4330A|nr:DUF2752 domain-containing protein [Nocardioides daejeonensis]
MALRLRDPHESGSWGYCPWKLLLGVDCPGCGGLRAVNDLTHGDVLSAASSNLIVVLVVPVAVLTWLFWVLRLRRGSGGFPAVPTWAWGSALVLLAGFTVVRNLPFGSWLAA